jgi:hypothetical protein
LEIVVFNSNTLRGYEFLGIVEFLGNDQMMFFGKPTPPGESTNYPSEFGNGTVILRRASGLSSGQQRSARASPVQVVLTYPGKWFLFDMSWNVLFDGQTIGVATVKQGFSLPVRTATGAHILTLQTGGISTTYNLQFDKPGRYEVKLDYSRTWGRWASETQIQYSP